MLRTRRERADLLRKGVDSSTIEELFLKHNNINLVRQPVLFDLFSDKLPTDMCKASQFEGRTIEVSHNKPGFLLITVLVFILAVMFPVSVLYVLILGLLFIPPVLAAVLIIFEFVCIISKEMERLSVLEKFAVVISR